MCCIGSYTRLAKFVEHETKTYSATIKLGEATPTGDTEAEVNDIAVVPTPVINATELEDMALKLTELPVPAYSAIKINGKRAYSLARAGVEVDMPFRPVTIESFRLTTNPPDKLFDENHQLSYTCTVTRGTYIRSLSEWLANCLGTIGHTVFLRREAIGDISIESAVELDMLTPENWFEHILPPCTALKSYPSYILDNEDVRRIRHGMDIVIAESTTPSKKEIVLYNNMHEPVAIGLRKDSIVHPYIVLA